MEEKRTKLQSGCLIALGSLFLIFLGVYLYFGVFQSGALIEGEYFRSYKQGDSTVYEGPLHDRQGTITMIPQENGANFQFQFDDAVSDDTFSGNFRVTFGEETEQGLEITTESNFNNGVGIGFGYYDHGIIFGEDGTPYSLISSISVNSQPYDWENFTPPVGDLADLAAGNNVVHRGNWFWFVVVSLLGGVAALITAFPMGWFRFQHLLSVRDPEPSDFYLTVMKLEWVACPVLLFIGYLWGFTFTS